MIKRRFFSILTIFLFIFILVTFLIPSDLVAETRKFWVDTSHWEDQDFWVTSGYLKDTWVDTSHNVLVESGYFQDTQEKRWVDTSHMVYQGYWKDVTESVWVDTSYFFGEGYWKDVTESVWVDTSHYEWVEEGHWKSEWVDTSHNVWVEEGHWVWVSSGYTANRWVDTSHNAWVASGYTANRWVVTSHWVWVTSGYSKNVWVDTSHWAYVGSKLTWISSGYWKSVWVDTSHNVWVESGYWQSYWVDTSHNVWVESGYWQSYWVDTSHNVWVESGYWQSYWVDTSHNVWVDTSHNAWVSSGYSQNVWVDTSHWVWVTSGCYEDQKVWVEGHYETRYREVEDWQPCVLTFVYQLLPSEPKNVILSKWDDSDETVYEGIINGIMYRYYKSYYLVLPGNNLFVPDLWPDDLWVLFKIKYKCCEVLNWIKEAYSVWVPPDYNKEWVDTSHWVKQGYWQSYTYRNWVDTSYMVESGYWEDYTERIWVDTSYNVWVSEGHYEKRWVDTSHYETRDVWVEDGFYTSPLHGEVIVEKSPRYIFTRWHKDQNNEECSMELNVSWKVDNSNLSEGEEEKEIVRIYIYQDICRFNNKGVEKVTIFNGNVTPSVEGSINTITKFDYSGTEESILHIYLYAQNGESAHIYFSNPINGFRSINLMSEGSNSDANTWLGGNNYVKFEF